MSSNIFRSKEYSAFNEYGSHIKEESDSIDIDVFMSELLEAYDEEKLKEVNDSARVKLQPNSNCKKSSRRKNQGENRRVEQ